MENTGTNREYSIPDELWNHLTGYRWHATSLKGLEGIVRSGAIEVRPEGYNGLCKSLEAISLFDFGPSAVDIKSGGHWSEWCGHQQTSSERSKGKPVKRVGIWLRLRDDYNNDRLIDAASLHKISQKQLNKLIIPGVEAAQLGSLPVCKLDQVVVVRKNCLVDFRVWKSMPTTDILNEVHEHISNLPKEPLSRWEAAYQKIHQEDLKYAI